MIYITGDTHRNFFNLQLFCDERNTTKDDILIILGDSGINYFLDTRDYVIKECLEKLPITLFLIYGNHEQRPNLIDTYKETTWNGATVYVEDDFPSLIFAQCGDIYNINGLKTLVIGGAYSIDKMYRLTMGANWFENEQPSDDIKAFAESNLDKHNWDVDVVLTHTAPEKYEPIEMFFDGIDPSTVDKSTEIWLDKIEDRLTYKKWFFGHYHCSKKIDKMEIMYHNIDVFKIG